MYFPHMILSSPSTVAWRTPFDADTLISFIGFDINKRFNIFSLPNRLFNIQLDEWWTSLLNFLLHCSYPSTPVDAKTEKEKIVARGTNITWLLETRVPSYRTCCNSTMVALPPLTSWCLTYMHTIRNVHYCTAVFTWLCFILISEQNSAAAMHFNLCNHKKQT